jgi:hypothetical protein
LVALHFLYYNFGRVHKILRVTPAKLDSPIMSSNSQFGLQHETGLQPAASEKKGSSEA